jgi:hypothetical protein
MITNKDLIRASNRRVATAKTLAAIRHDMTLFGPFSAHRPVLDRMESEYVQKLREAVSMENDLRGKYERGE